jgi:hypothetical protein
MEKKNKELNNKERYKRGIKKEEITIGCPSVGCNCETIDDYWDVLLITISDTAGLCI